MVVAELRGTMALVAQDAGGDVLALSGVQLLHVVVVGKEGPAAPNMSHLPLSRIRSISSGSWKPPTGSSNALTPACFIRPQASTAGWSPGVKL